MNKTILKAIERIRWNTEHHFLHIKNQHEIAPQIGVQFSMGYTDARFIQFFLEDQEDQTDLWDEFTKTFVEISEYELAFIKGGLAGFNEQYGSEDQMKHYEATQTAMLLILDKVRFLALTY